MTTRHMARTGTRRPYRSNRADLVIRPMAGQCFEIEIESRASVWAIRIPEIGAGTEAPTRAAVELAARECIARNTGIPIGYISVWVRD